MDILGVRIDNFYKHEILEKVESFLDEEKFHQIATINPEFILAAQRDLEFKNILNKCALNVADGSGLKYAFIRNFSWLKARFAGVDLMQEILEIAERKKLSVFLAISKNSLSGFEEIKTVLLKKYPNLKIDGFAIDPLNSGSYKIQDTKYRILFCNFGAPYQEKFLNLQKNGNIRIAMGVGGSFDFMTGKTRRAPKLIQSLGLEWLFRLCQEPKYRIKRIFNAVIVFPLKVIFSK